MQEQFYDALEPDENSENKIRLFYWNSLFQKSKYFFTLDGLCLLRILKYCYNRAILKLIINRGNVARVWGIHERPDTPDLYRSESDITVTLCI